MTADRDDIISEPGTRFYITVAELADRWRLTTRTLERWRAEHYGPPWITIGGSIRYRLDDVLAFEARHRSGPTG